MHPCVQAAAVLGWPVPSRSRRHSFIFVQFRPRLRVSTAVLRCYAYCVLISWSSSMCETTLEPDRPDWSDENWSGETLTTTYGKTGVSECLGGRCVQLVGATGGWWLVGAGEESKVCAGR